MIIEPVLGSGGCIAPPDAFWPALTALCSEHDWLLCADEVKTGFGRSGTMLAVERWGVEPDLICLGKAMGGGVMPIGAVLGSEAVLGEVDDLSTGSTWAWLPGSVAAALATLDAYEREDVLGNVAELEAVAATGARRARRLATSGSARSGRSAASWRSSSSATPRPASATSRSARRSRRRRCAAACSPTPARPRSTCSRPC